MLNLVPRTDVSRDMAFSNQRSKAEKASTNSSGRNREGLFQGHALITRWFLPCWIWWSLLSPQFIHTSSSLSHRRLFLFGKSVFTWSPQCEKWTRINTFMIWLGQGHYFIFSGIPSTWDSIFHVWGTELSVEWWVQIRRSKVQLTGQIWLTACFCK